MNFNDFVWCFCRILCNKNDYKIDSGINGLLWQHHEEKKEQEIDRQTMFIFTHTHKLKLTLTCNLPTDTIEHLFRHASLTLEVISQPLHHKIVIRHNFHRFQKIL